MRVVSANVNGIRAAARRGGLAALAELRADVICLQEVRADQVTAAQAIISSPLAGHEMRTAPGRRPGHAGVAVLVRPGVEVIWRDVEPDTDRRRNLLADGRDGRWLECELPTNWGAPLHLACAYAPTGAGGGAAATFKDQFLRGVGDWLEGHCATAALMVGDLNVAHTPADIRNWRGNLGKPGFLASERAHLDRWLADSPPGLGWLDVGRAVAGPGPGPYTWWSWRGRAFDNDSGWRIDYMLASPLVAARIQSMSVDRAPSYAARWSDHAALILDIAARAAV